MPQEAIWVIGVLLGVIQAWFWYDRQRIDKDLDNLAKKCSMVESQVNTVSNKQQHYATHSEVRDLIRENIEPLRNDQRETKDLAREINSAVNQLARDIAVLNVLRGLENNGKNKDFSG